MNDQSKNLLQSKTLIASAALPLLTLVPGVKDVVAQNPQETMAAIGGIFAILRMVTGKAIQNPFGN